MDLVIAFPLILMALALSQPISQRLESLGLGEGAARITYLLLILGLLRLTLSARASSEDRSSAFERRDYVDAAVSLGARTARVLFIDPARTTVRPRSSSSRPWGFQTHRRSKPSWRLPSVSTCFPPNTDLPGDMLGKTTTDYRSRSYRRCSSCPGRAAAVVVPP